MHGVTVTVVSFVRSAEGVATGSVTGSASSQAQVTALVEAADAAARAGSPAEDANDLVAGDAAADWDEAPVHTDIHVYDAFAPALGEAFGRAGSAGRVLYGFVNHELTTTYLGSSTGLRLRHVQPTGHYGCTGKTADLSQSAWVGGATRDFTDVDALAMEESLAQRLGWGKRRVDLPAGRYDTMLPPAAVADLMIDAYWYAGARVAWEGQSVYSKRGVGTRIGDRHRQPRRQPVLRPGSAPACSARRSRWRPPRTTSSRSSTTGCRWAAPTGSGTASSPRCSRPGTPPR